MKTIISLFFCFCILSAVSFSQDAMLNSKDNSRTFKTQSISVFKNGTAFYQKTSVLDFSKGIVRLNSQDFNTKDILFGTLWFNTPGNNIKTVANSELEIEKEVAVSNLEELIKMNIGKDATITVMKRNEPIYAKISSIEQGMVMLESKATWIAVRLEDIIGIEFNGKPVQKIQRKEKQNIIEIETLTKNSAQTIDLCYMQRGLTWIPNYYIRLINDKKAEMVLQALAINDNEDIENTTLNFVVGIPSFEHSNTLSPFSSHQSVADFLGSLNRTQSNSRYQAMSNVITQQSMNMDNESTDVDFREFAANGETIDEGLFFYKKENVNLKKNGRAFFEIFSSEIEYEQLFSVDLQPNQNKSYYYESSRNNKERTNPVWQSIRFVNNTKVPFTTGTAFVMRKGETDTKPVSENTLYYTPQGVKATLKTTIAPDISVTDNEYEISRKENVIKYYDLITIEAVINVTNYKEKEINLSVKRTITGELLRSDADWKSTSQLKSNDSKNKDNNTTWDIQLKPKETKKITYSYQIYVAR